MLRLDAQGKAQWAKLIKAGSAGQSGPPRLYVDENGAVYVAGLTYVSTVDFGDGITAATGDSNTQTGWVGRIDPNGTAKWVRLVFAKLGVSDIAVAVRNGKVAVGGTFVPYDPLRYYTSTGYVTAPNVFRESERAAYVLSLGSTDGFAQWAAFFGSMRTAAYISQAGITSVSIDAAGEIDAAGAYRGDVLKDQAQTTIATPTAAGFVFRLTSTGTLKWIRAIVDTDPQILSGDVATGAFTGNVDFGKGTRTGPGIYAASFDPENGNTTFDNTFGKVGKQYAMALDSVGGMVVGVNTPPEGSYVVAFRRQASRGGARHSRWMSLRVDWQSAAAWRWPVRSRRAGTSAAAR